MDLFSVSYDDLNDMGIIDWSQGRGSFSVCKVAFNTEKPLA